MNSSSAGNGFRLTSLYSRYIFTIFHCHKWNIKWSSCYSEQLLKRNLNPLIGCVWRHSSQNPFWLRSMSFRNRGFKKWLNKNWTELSDFELIIIVPNNCIKTWTFSKTKWCHHTYSSPKMAMKARPICAFSSEL